MCVCLCERISIWVGGCACLCKCGCVCAGVCVHVHVRMCECVWALCACTCLCMSVVCVVCVYVCRCVCLCRCECVHTCVPLRVHVCLLLALPESAWTCPQCQARSPSSIGVPRRGHQQLRGSRCNSRKDREAAAVALTKHGGRPACTWARAGNKC